jgi:xanthine dehydrogenase accessory factor
MNGAIIIPAAGASRRFGAEDKLLQPVDGIPLVRRTALLALASGQDVLVTLRPHDHARRAALAGLGVTMLDVSDAAEGMAASLRCAAQALGSETALMVLPADMPEIGVADLARLWQTHAAQPNRIVLGTAGDVPGHPVIFPGPIVPELAALVGDIGARPILQRHRQRILPVPLFGRRAILDIDTPQQWADWVTSRSSVDVAAYRPTDAALAALNDPQDCVLAVITAVQGAGWHVPGTMMCLWRDGSVLGQLTGGCVEGDLALRVGNVLDTGKPTHLRYGAGSAFFDIRLPCGGGLDIMLFPVRDTRALSDFACLDRARADAGLRFLPGGALRLDLSTGTGWDGPDFVAARVPQVQFLVFGSGEDARIFGDIARAAGYGVVAADQTARDRLAMTDHPNTEEMLLLADARTAVVTFSHDVEKDIDMLAAALRGPAFYVGALGSHRVAAQRLGLLRARGIGRDLLARLHGPIGLVPSTRDARGLAVSILAEIVALELAPRTRTISTLTRIGRDKGATQMQAAPATRAQHRKTLTGE